jgi:hypothetical protein
MSKIYTKWEKLNELRAECKSARGHRPCSAYQSAL